MWLSGCCHWFSPTHNLGASSSAAATAAAATKNLMGVWSNKQTTKQRCNGWLFLWWWRWRRWWWWWRWSKEASRWSHTRHMTYAAGCVSGRVECDSEAAAHSSAGDVEVMWSDRAHERPPDSYFGDLLLLFIFFQVVLTARGLLEISNWQTVASRNRVQLFEISFEIRKHCSYSWHPLIFLENINP